MNDNFRLERRVPMAVIVTLVALPSKMRRSALRASFAISRSKVRTPASRVYFWISARRPSSVSVNSPAFRPCASICLSSKCPLAISTFSSSV